MRNSHSRLMRRQEMNGVPQLVMAAGYQPQTGQFAAAAIPHAMPAGTDYRGYSVPYASTPQLSPAAVQMQPQQLQVQHLPLRSHSHSPLHQAQQVYASDLSTASALASTAVSAAANGYALLPASTVAAVAMSATPAAASSQQALTTQVAGVTASTSATELQQVQSQFQHLSLDTTQQQQQQPQQAQQAQLYAPQQLTQMAGVDTQLYAPQPLSQTYLMQPQTVQQQLALQQQQHQHQQIPYHQQLQHTQSYIAADGSTIAYAVPQQQYQTLQMQVLCVSQLLSSARLCSHAVWSPNDAWLPTAATVLSAHCRLFAALQAGSRAFSCVG